MSVLCLIMGRQIIPGQCTPIAVMTVKRQLLIFCKWQILILRMAEWGGDIFYEKHPYTWSGAK